MDVLLIVVDSLRAEPIAGHAARTPFLDRLRLKTQYFTRAYATECWTLPTHVSMFTGLLPSEHGAHFQHMGYTERAPTVAELFADAGYETELVTRNSIFDGTLPGVTRGFQKNTRITSRRAVGHNPLAWMLAASKPRFRRQVLTTGFFHPRQRSAESFVTRFAQASLPADAELLTYLASRVSELRRASKPFFLFANLYDVHAPYCPTTTSLFDRWSSLRNWESNLRMIFTLPRLGGHHYLREGFRLSPRSRSALAARYRAAVELMDAKLDNFWERLGDLGALEDTLIVLTSDHGEAFGEHGLYLHDASVYQTHLHVPLYISHPAVPPGIVTDVVSTRDLFGILRAAIAGPSANRTIADGEFRARRPVAVAEHFHYQNAPWIAPRYRHDLKAFVSKTHKLLKRGDSCEVFDLVADPEENAPYAHGADTPQWRQLEEVASAQDQLQKSAASSPPMRNRP